MGMMVSQCSTFIGNTNDLSFDITDRETSFMANQCRVLERIACDAGREMGKENINLTSSSREAYRKSFDLGLVKQIQLMTIAFILAGEIIILTKSSQYQNESGLSNDVRNIFRPLIALVAAENDDRYADASADSPSVDSLDDDDDNEELDSSASNEYPDGDNDNDESYDDADDERQESRTHNRWLYLDDPKITRNNLME